MLKWLLVLAVVLLFFGGARKLPELARTLGKSVRSFREGSGERSEAQPDAIEPPPSTALPKP